MSRLNESVHLLLFRIQNTLHHMTSKFTTALAGGTGALVGLVAATIFHQDGERVAIRRGQYYRAQLNEKRYDLLHDTYLAKYRTAHHQEAVWRMASMAIESALRQEPRMNISTTELDKIKRDRENTF
jgi:hypothetical protein